MDPAPANGARPALLALVGGDFSFPAPHKFYF